MQYREQVAERATCFLYAQEATFIKNSNPGTLKVRATAPPHTAPDG